MKRMLVLVQLLFVSITFSQTTYFWRNDQNPGNNASWENNSPIYFWNIAGNFAAIPPGGEIIAFDGNQGLTMTNNLNATNRYRFEFFPNNAASRTINGTTPNIFFDFSNIIPAIYNSSEVQHTINFPILIGNVSSQTNPAYGFEINAFSGDFVVGSDIAPENSTGQKVLVLMANDQNNGGFGSIVCSGNITDGVGSLALLKKDENTATITGVNNTYTGNTTINAGTLRFNPSGNTTMNSSFVLNGGTLSTTGIAGGRSISTSGTLQLNANATIDLSSDKHDINFANSSATSWNSTAALTINNWQGTAGTSGTGGQIFIGTNDTGLSGTQISQITFSGFTNGAMLLTTGELVPAPNNLPVEFLGMSAGCLSDGTVSLHWETASECNASHFVIERSMNGLHWDYVAALDAIGNSILRQSYTFVDDKPIRTSLSYYRLVQYDFDGKNETFGPISNWCENGKNDFVCFPNPAQNLVHISFSWDRTQTDILLTVYDLNGKEIKQSSHTALPGNNLIATSISNFEQGMYRFVLRSGSDVLQIMPVVKE
jgi:autotransporter-associated beta strand protein